MSEELKVPTPDETSEKRQESVRIITEQMTELGQVLENVKKDQAVDKNTAIGLEQISPGIVTEVIPLNGFTDKPSRTNYQLVVNRIGDRIKVLGDEKRGIILEDEPFEKAEQAEGEASKVSVIVDDVIQLAESLESYKGDVDETTLVAMRAQLEKYSKSIGAAVHFSTSMESFQSSSKSTAELVVSMEEGIWEAVKAAMSKFWEWVKQVFSKMIDWFKGNDPVKRLQNIEEMMKEFEGDNTTFEIELSDPEMQRVTLGGKVVPDMIRGINDYIKLATVGSELLPTVVKSNLEAIDLVYAWVNKNAEGLNEAALGKQVMAIAVDISRKYSNVTDPTLQAKKYSSVVTDEKDKILLHYLGGFHFALNTQSTGGLRVVTKYSTGKDAAEVKGAKYKLRGSDAKHAGETMKKVLDLGWNDKHVRELEKLNKDILAIEGKYKAVKDKFANDKAMASISQTLTKIEKTGMTVALSAITSHAQALKHLEAMERFIIGVYSKAKKGEDKKETGKPATA